MQTDVEGTFGILKGWWQNGVCVVDKVWLTCYALHNWLLDKDGNGDEWAGGVSIDDWLGELGQIDFEDDEGKSPAVFDWLLCYLNIRNYDSSGMGPGLQKMK